MKAATARTGIPFKVRKVELDFSFFPVRKSPRRYAQHSVLYASDPWAVFLESARHIGNSQDRISAQSYVRQAREFFSAAKNSGTIEATPLLYYYSFMNLGKALCLIRGNNRVTGQVMHGLSKAQGAGHAVHTAGVMTHSSSANSINLFAEINSVLEAEYSLGGEYSIANLVAQSFIGHRFWQNTNSPPKIGLFVAISRIRWFHDPVNKLVWLRIYLERETMHSRSQTLKKVLDSVGIKDKFRHIVDVNEDTSAYYVLEEASPQRYSGSPLDVVSKVIEKHRKTIWQSVTSAPPYRAHYLHTSEDASIRLPQWASAYALFFWLGSLTRYQPVELLELFDGSFGAFFREFLETEPTQLLYLFASEAKQQIVTRSGVV